MRARLAPEIARGLLVLGRYHEERAHHGAQRIGHCHDHVREDDSEKVESIPSLEYNGSSAMPTVMVGKASGMLEKPSTNWMNRPFPPCVRAPKT